MVERVEKVQRDETTGWLMSSSTTSCTLYPYRYFFCNENSWSIMNDEDVVVPDKKAPV